MIEDRPSFLDQKKEVASIRSNNPGAIWDAPFTRKRGAIGGAKLNDGLGQGNSIAYFDDAIDGARVLFQLLDVGYTKRTVRRAIHKWSGGNWVQSYLNVLRQRANVSPDEMITKDKLRNPEWAIPFAAAMAWHEAGKEYPLEDQHWRQAHAEAFDLAQEKPAPVVVAEKVGAVSIKKPASALTVVGGVSEMLFGWVDPLLAFLNKTATQVSELGNVKVMFAEVGANTHAVGLGILIIAAAVVLKSFAREDNA